MNEDEKRIFGQRLKALREMKGLSQANLAKRMDGLITPQAIYKYENGKMSPDSVVLIRLAEVLGVDAGAFFRPAGVQVEGFAFRKLSTLGVKRQKAIEMQVVDAIERYAEIEDILGLDEQFDKSPFGRPVSSLDDAKEVARTLRKEWRLGEDGIACLLPLLEEHHVRVIEIEEKEKFSGLSGWAGEMPIVVVKKDERTERKRFTALHELGHLILNMTEKVNDKEKETLCNQFANEVLLPECAVKKVLGDSGDKVLSLHELVELQKQYGISIDAIVYKLHEMGIFNENRYVNYFKRKRVDKGFKDFVELSRIEEEHSDRFECLVYKAYVMELTSLSKTSELLAEPEKEIFKKAISL